jgi:hypothetical protein
MGGPYQADENWPCCERNPGEAVKDFTVLREVRVGKKILD